jgi:hypothetical protein
MTNHSWLLVVALLNCIAFCILRWLYPKIVCAAVDIPVNGKRAILRKALLAATKPYSLLMVAWLNCIAAGIFYLFSPAIQRATQGIPTTGKCVILLVGLLAWIFASIFEAIPHTRPADFIPFRDVYYKSGTVVFGWIQIVSVYVVVAMLAHFLGGVSGIVFFLISVGGTVCLSLAADFLVRTIERILYRDPGNATVSSHRVIWQYGLQRTEGVATERPVYEHYHGQFSWYKRYAGLLSFLRLLAFAFSTASPLALLMSNKEWGIVSPSNATSWFVLAVTALISFVILYVVPGFRGK